MCSNQAGGGGLPVISVDLHCAFVDEALETVESGIRNLPEVGALVIGEQQRGMAWHGMAVSNVLLQLAMHFGDACGAPPHRQLQCLTRPPVCHSVPLSFADALLLLCPSWLQSIPGGVVVRYITGRGLHSADGKARIKPEARPLCSLLLKLGDVESMRGLVRMIYDNVPRC